MREGVKAFAKSFITRGARKAGLGYVYLVGHFVLAFVIVIFRPEMGLAGLAALGGALAAGLGTVIAGHAYEGRNGNTPSEPPAAT